MQTMQPNVWDIPLEIWNTLADLHFHCDVKAVRKVGEGFYGVVYQLELTGQPKRVIVKCYKHKGNHRKEFHQLALLRKYALLNIPMVYAIQDGEAGFPCDMLCMEQVTGINASMLPADYPHRDRFADEMIHNLLHLHQSTEPRGFGDGERMFSTWNACYLERIGTLHQALHKELSTVVSPSVREIADRSVDAFDQIFSQPVARSSLVHGDYNLWNLLVDPETGHITAVIDPNDAGWADRELDLFHLQNADGDRFHLLERYKNQWPVSELFPVKNAFYWFWDDMKHLYRMGWYEEEHFQRRAKHLQEQMAQCL